MLKKAGIVVAAATAGLLALSPLAFAGDKGHEDTKGDHAAPTTSVVSEETTSRSPECTFEADADNSVEQAGEGGDAGLVGAAGGLVTQLGAPINAQTQAPVGSCNNIEDIANINVEDNLQDNDEDNDEITTDIEDSGNTTEG